MPNLGDYVGHLLSEITAARFQADLATVRIAEMYASHPLLKLMAVPKFRLPAVTLDVPVAIQELEQPAPGGAPLGGVDLPGVRASFASRFSIYLNNAGLVFKKPAQVYLNVELDQAIARLSAQPDFAMSPSSIADELISTIVRALGNGERAGMSISPEFLVKFAEDLKGPVQIDVLGHMKPLPRLKVLVTTAELREAGPPDLLARIRLTIAEEGVQWTVIESEGKKQDRLVPE